MIAPTFVKYSPVGELVLLAALKAMRRGVDAEEAARRVVELANVNYNYKVWRRLVEPYVNGNAPNERGLALLACEKEIIQHVLKIDEKMKKAAEYVESL